jgi:hypothetical protein
MCSQQLGQFCRIKFIVLVLAGMYAAQIQGMCQYESDAGILAGIGEPVPVEGALTADGEVVAVRLYKFKEVTEVIALDVPVDEYITVPVNNAGIHAF